MHRLKAFALKKLYIACMSLKVQSGAMKLKKNVMLHGTLQMKRLISLVILLPVMRSMQVVNYLDTTISAHGD